MYKDYSGPKVDIQPDDLSKYENGDWVIEPKIDGMWAAMVVKSGSLSFYSRAGLTPDKCYISELSKFKLPFDNAIICGELNASTDRASRDYARNGFYSFYAFDILEVGKNDFRKLSYLDRRKKLSLVFQEINFLYSHLPGRLLEVPYAGNLFRHRYEHIVSNSGEGVILKNIHAKFTAGKNEDIVRCKERLTDDFVLMDIGTTDGGDKTGVWGQYHNGKLHYVMRSQPKDMSILCEANIGNYVAEFVGCGRQSSGTLRSAQFIRGRSDKNPEECILKNIGEKLPTRKK